jgi:hypothetical protein
MKTQPSKSAVTQAISVQPAPEITNSASASQAAFNSQFLHYYVKESHYVTEKKMLPV